MKLIYGSILSAGLIAGTLLAQQETIKMGLQMKDDMKDTMAARMSEMKQKMAAKGAEGMDGHREMAQLVDKLARSLTAIEAEKDPSALAAKLAEHRKLIEQLQAHVARHESDPAAANPVPAATPADPHAGHR